MRRLTFLIFVSLVSLTSFGQTLNVQTGPTFSSLDWNNDATSLSYYNDMMIGYSFFVGLDYLDAKYYNLSSNFGMVRKGGKEPFLSIEYFGDPGVVKNIYAKMDYLSVNTLIDLKYPISDKISPYISLGPRIDYLVGFSNELDNLTGKDDLNLLQYGFVLGGGLKYNLRKLQVGIHADYYLNLNNAANWSVTSAHYKGKISDKTVVLNLSIGYKL